ncbi:peptidyl-tRNA hydrolase [Pichia kudriavzevii]|uniref:peptidyl-tRNA hydrolase n=1 Tax=Pichia kudriavzevii TaxID=4909 RepID=A0A099NWY1_PICKU|nr:uncharacterized protein C5L36_0A00160 [Pichia kudriavzevii]AWU73402.1 hypothetical protein C5L36_0A00160 [Pichia kudriavzevii]KGK36479.1 hypothetical protein JL09_g4379 [Pichia kudriavzevii]ONH72705.1 Peptidyl-tRNA hydrolase 2 [Pichia kudriavzevii]OUT22902.1 peptidyl-tRNA hydrolase [Pichia kudriavzevii]
MSNSASFAVIAGLFGVLSGIYIGTHLNVIPNSGLPKKLKKIANAEDNAPSDDENYSDDEDGGIEVNSGSLNEIGGEVRMALVVRTDLGMLKGKVAAQCSHAAVALYRKNLVNNPTMLKRWENCGQAKITLKCVSLEDIEELQAKAASLNIENYLVHDAGRTQIASGSATVLGLGPAPKAIMDMVTGELKLY